MPTIRPALCLLLAASLAPAADTTVKFTVSAGKHARKNEPVRVPLQLPVKAPDGRVHVKNDKDKIIAQGQLAAPDLEYLYRLSRGFERRAVPHRVARWTVAVDQDPPSTSQPTYNGPRSGAACGAFWHSRWHVEKESDDRTLRPHRSGSGSRGLRHRPLRLEGRS